MRREVLLEAKRRSGLSYRQLSAKTGLSYTYIQQILAGAAHNPSLSVLTKLCHSLGVPVSDVVADEPAERDAGESAS